MTDHEISRMLVCSTAHLPEPLIGVNEGGPPCPLLYLDGVIAYEKGDYGVFLWVPDDPEEHAADRPSEADAAIIRDAFDDDPEMWVEAFPRVILDLQLYARGLGCDWIMLDCDGPEIVGLPKWNW